MKELDGQLATARARGLVDMRPTFAPDARGKPQTLAEEVAHLAVMVNLLKMSNGQKWTSTAVTYVGRDNFLFDCDLGGA